MIDLHSHLLPFVDDGAEDWDHARIALETVARAGVRTATASPHILGSLTGDPAALRGRLAELDEVWPDFLALAAAAVPGVSVVRAAEVMLDRPGVDLSDPRLRLDGTRFALVEFPYMSVPPRSVETLHALRRDGWTPVVAHPERYRGVSRLLEIAGEWRRVGAVLQVNAGSLLGAYGQQPKASALLLLRAGLVDVIASDYHARGPFLSPAARAFLQQDHRAPAALLDALFVVNPGRLLEGRDPEPVGPLPPRVPRWKRMFR
ncbi:MAG TPA: CpsB/CapC family capsule biosynthesis tyrosine phosphatase [Longimicrobiales bacterium]|nr:CpsB/CapC family capsule biosynthesis tyrosine phosphatase [Longimicrobiales bacterium]